MKRFGGTDIDLANSTIQTFDNGLVFAGETKSFGAGDSDALIGKLSPNGTLLWAKAIGFSDFDKATSIIETSDNGLVFVGETDFFSNGSPPIDALIVKLYSNGTLQWAKYLDGFFNNNIGTSIIETSDKGLMFIGKIRHTGLVVTFIVRLNQDGVKLWSTVLASSITKFTDYSSIIALLNNSFVVSTGRIDSFSSALLAKFSENGVLIEKFYGGIESNCTDPPPHIFTSDITFSINVLDITDNITEVLGYPNPEFMGNVTCEDITDQVVLNNITLTSNQECFVSMAPTSSPTCYVPMISALD